MIAGLRWLGINLVFRRKFFEITLAMETACYSLTSLTLLASHSAPILPIGNFIRYLRNVMYRAHCLVCNATSVRYGMKSPWKRRTARTPLTSLSWTTFALFTSHYTLAPMPPRRNSPLLPLICIMRIGRRHIRCATSRVIVQIRRPTVTMKRLKMILLLSTQAFILSHIIVLVLFWSPVLVHLICPRTILLETLQTSQSVTSLMRPNPTLPFHSLTRPPPLLLPTSTLILSLEMRFLLTRA